MRSVRPLRAFVVLAATALLAGACGDDSGVGSGDAGGAGTSTSTSTSVDTGIDETTTSAPSDTTTAETSTTTSTTIAPTTIAPTTEPPTTPAPTAPPTTAAPTTAAPTTVPGGPTALPTNTNLQPSSALVFTVPGGGDFCTDFPNAGWVTVYCESFVALDNFYAVVQRAGDDGRHRVFVMVPSGAVGTYVQEYGVEEPGAGTWSAVTVVHGSFHFGEGPFNGDAEGLWVGYRYEGTGQYLDVDIIEWFEDGTARRGALKELDHGAVDVRPGGADVVSAQYAATDPGCCPSKFRVREITWSSNRWRIDAGVLVDPDDPLLLITSDF